MSYDERTIEIFNWPINNSFDLLHIHKCLLNSHLVSFLLNKFLYILFYYCSLSSWTYMTLWLHYVWIDVDVCRLWSTFKYVNINLAWYNVILNNMSIFYFQKKTICRTIFRVLLANLKVKSNFTVTTSIIAHYGSIQ